MPETQEAMESNYIDADFIDRSPTKVCVPTGEGSFESVQFDKNKAPSRKLTIPVEIDGKQKSWRPNRESVANMQIYGSNSRAWIGKRILLRSSGVGQYRKVIGYPGDDVQPAPQHVPGVPAPRKLAPAEIPAYGQGQGVEFSRGTGQAPPGYDDGGQF